LNSLPEEVLLDDEGRGSQLSFHRSRKDYRMFSKPSPRIGALALLLLIAGSGPPPSEAAVVQYDLEKLTQRSELIVRGEVIGIRSHWGTIGELGPLILTEVTVRVSEKWKGSLPGGEIADEIKVQLLGGRIGERWQFCADSPRFTKGEQVLLFARKWRGALWTTGWTQGKYQLAESREKVLQVLGKKRCPIETTLPLATLRTKVRDIIQKPGSAEGAVLKPESSPGSSPEASPREGDS